MEHQTEPVTMWFDRRLVMRTSPIHGIGTFATDAVHAGERLIRVSGGIIYTSEAWRTGKTRLAPEQYNETQLDDDLFIATPKSLYHYVNHSCDPNDCVYCGSAFCRGRMTGNHRKLPELQQR